MFPPPHQFSSGSMKKKSSLGNKFRADQFFSQRFSSGYGVEISPIQKRPKLSFDNQYNNSLLEMSTDNDASNNSVLSSNPSRKVNNSSVNSSTFLSTSNRYYSKLKSRSHLPLSSEMLTILRGVFDCAAVNYGAHESDNEVNLIGFIDDITENDCVSIVCGVSQHHDLVQGLQRIYQTLSSDMTANERAHGVWINWSALITHIESESQPSSASVSYKKALLEKKTNLQEELDRRRKVNRYNAMSREWASNSKEEYAKFLAEIVPDYWHHELPQDKLRGGGGAVASKQRESGGFDVTLHNDGRDEVKVDDGDSKGSRYFREIQFKLQQLDIETRDNQQLLQVSDRVADEMAHKEENDLASQREIERLEAECSPEGDTGGARHIDLVAMRRKKLPPEEEDAVDKALASPHNGSLLIEKFNQDITRQKMSCLLPGTWLNDEVVNFYMNMLQERDKALCAISNSNRRSSHFFNSFFVTKLLEQGEYTYRNVKRWTKKFDIFSKDKVFFPVNISNTHWTMMVAYIQKKKVVYYDSMGGSGSSYLKAILRYLNDESVDKRKQPLNVEEWTTEATGRSGAPQQQNGYDCGMFSTMYADFLSDDLPLAFDQSEICEYRRKTVAAILRGQLNYPISDS